MSLRQMGSVGCGRKNPGWYHGSVWAPGKKMRPKMQRPQAKQVHPINSALRTWSMVPIRCPSKVVMTASPPICENHILWERCFGIRELSDISQVRNGYPNQNGPRQWSVHYAAVIQTSSFFRCQLDHLFPWIFKDIFLVIRTHNFR